MIAPEYPGRREIGTVKSNSWEIKSCQPPGVGPLMVGVAATQRPTAKSERGLLCQWASRS